ncbi:unnamed protein product [Didymodactylos carnosus]|uniref:CFA20 domain-containing protein n=1 Tax=Didymodactylos carnosus TaxID=1234261 RepID=A0A814FBT0_9BILA|nr:unnamed protein product [Didymodactylos carnosus]CAF3752092.1 unnamed protein product [Didymodactylos carnosus]
MYYHFSTFITCPCSPQESLGVKMQYLNLYIKNLRRYFVMEIEVLDSKHMHRRFKISSFASRTKIGIFGTHSPLNWIEGWNRLSLNLDSFTKTVYGTDYIECTRLTIHANCRIRRVFFADREYKEDELPVDYQIRCRIDRTKRHPTQNRRIPFQTKKSVYETKNAVKEKRLKEDRSGALPEVQEFTSNFMPVGGVSAPQGSVASDIQQVDGNNKDEITDSEDGEKAMGGLLSDEESALSQDMRQTDDLGAMRGKSYSEIEQSNEVLLSGDRKSRNIEPDVTATDEMNDTLAAEVERTRRQLHNTWEQGGDPLQTNNLSTDDLSTNAYRLARTRFMKLFQ